MVSNWRPTAKVDAVRIDITREYVKEPPAGAGALAWSGCASLGLEVRAEVGALA